MVRIVPAENAHMLFCYYQWLCQPKTEMASIATNFLGLSEFPIIADTSEAFKHP